MRVRAMTPWFALVLLGACDLTIGSGSDSGGATTEDGAVCQTSDECKSGQCLFNLCSASSCSCSDGACTAKGEASSDCGSGWVCAHFESDDIFFGSSSSDRCAHPCPHCPEHFSCSDGDDFCSADASWTDPVVTVKATPTAVAPGDTVHFQATAKSPVGDTDFTFTWHFTDGTGGSPTGAKVSHKYLKSGIYTEDLQVDAHADTLHTDATVEVVVCGIAGTPCGDTDYADWAPCCTGLTCTMDGTGFDSNCQ